MRAERIPLVRQLDASARRLDSELLRDVKTVGGLMAAKGSRRKLPKRITYLRWLRSDELHKPRRFRFRLWIGIAP